MSKTLPDILLIIVVTISALTQILSQNLIPTTETFYSDDSNSTEEGYCIIHTQDQNLLIVGEDYPNGFSDQSVVRKVDYNGNIIWSTTLSDPLFEFDFPSAEIDVAVMAIELIDAYIVLVKASNFINNEAYGLFRLEKSAGIIQDVRRVEEPIQMRSKALFAISETEFTVGTANAKIQTYDRFLNPISSKSYGNSNPFPGFSWGQSIIDIERLSDGSILFVGQIEDGLEPCECLFFFNNPHKKSRSIIPDANTDVWILKMNSALSAPVYSKSMGSERPDIAIDATFSPDNGFVIIGNTSECNGFINPPGCTYQTLGPNNIGEGGWVWKFDQNGNQDQNIFPFFFYDGIDRATGRHIMYEPGCKNYYLTGFGDHNFNPFGYVQRLDEQLNIIEDGLSSSDAGETKFNHSVFANNRLYALGSKTESGISAPVTPPLTDGEDMVLTQFVSSGQFGKSENLTITDNTTISSNVTVNNVLGSIKEMSLFINLEHTYIGDLIIELTSPSGKSALVFIRECSDEDNITYSFKDTGVLQPVCPLVDFLIIPIPPAKPVEPFSIFDGEDPNGNWTLSISDNASQDQGTLLYWELTIDNNFCELDCPPSYSGANNNLLTGTQSTDADYETDGVLQSNQVIIGQSTVDYDSGISIDLLQPFEVKSGSVFHAFIDGCLGAQ